MALINKPTIPTIRNIALVSRYEKMTTQIGGILDGSLATVESLLEMGTLMAYNAATQKWHPFVKGTDTMASGMLAIVQDEIPVSAGQDTPFTGFWTGFFNLDSLLGANPGMVAADFVAPFQAVPAKPGDIRFEVTKGFVA